MMLMPFELITPSNLQEAVDSLSKLDGSVKVIAGGTDVLVAMHGGKLRTDYIVDIKGVEELQEKPVYNKDGLTFSALTTHDEIENIPEVALYYSALKDAVSRIGSVQTRMRGTVGGNICTAVPSGDSLGPLLAFGAELTLFSKEGYRTLAFEDFFVAAKKTVIKDDEILCSIHLPHPMEGLGSYYTKFMRRKAMDLAMMGVTVCLALDEDGTCSQARIALSTSAPTPMRAKKAEAFLLGKALEDEVLAEAGRMASSEASPRNSWRSPVEYRRALIEVIVPRTAKSALERIQKGGAA